MEIVTSKVTLLFIPHSEGSIYLYQVSEKTHATLNGGFGGTAFYISTEDNNNQDG
jgi:hypothetical protein